MCDPREYFDADDRDELVELIAVTLDWAADAVRCEQYAAAACVSAWTEELRGRLEVVSYLSCVGATEGSVRSR